MIWTTLQVALGGAIGAALRFLAGVGVFKLTGPTGPGFPLAILGVNITGSLLMGLFAGFAAQRDVAQMSPFIMTGLLGGFTTFSAFSLETFMLFERGQVASAAIYVVASVMFSVLGLAVGVWLMRQVMG